MAEQEQNAAVGLEERLSSFDALTNEGDTFEDVLKGLESNVESKSPEPEEKPASEPEASEEKPEDSAETEAEQPESVPEETGEEEKGSDEEDDFLNEFGESTEEKSEEDEDDTPPKSVRSEKGKKDWREMVSERKALRSQLKERDAELETLRKQVAELPELRKKAEYLEEAEKELALSRVEATQEYKEKIARPLKEIESTALQIAKSNDVSADKLFDALSEPDAGERRRLLKEITEDMDAVDRDDVFQMARSTQTLLAEQNDIRAKAREAAKESTEIQQKRQAQESAQARQQYETELEEVVPAIRERFPFEELEKGETADSVYSVIAQRAESTDFGQFSPRQKAFAVTSALMMPRLAKQLKAYVDKIKTLESRVKELNKKEPRVGDSKVETPTDDFGGDIEAAVMAATGGKSPQHITNILAEFSD